MGKTFYLAKQIIFVICSVITILFATCTSANAITITGGGNGEGTSIPIGTGMNGVAYGNNTYVIVGGSAAKTSGGTTIPAKGHILYSSDAVNWSTVQDSSFSVIFDEVEFGNGIFVAVGSDGTIVTSIDGKNWTKQISNTTTSLTDLKYIGDSFFAVGGNGTVLTSKDGTSWTSVNIGSSTVSLTNIAYGNGVYAICGRDTDNKSYVYYSSTGLSNSWSKAQIGSVGTCVNNIVFLKDKFFVFNADCSIYTSSNASSWSSLTNPMLTSPSQIFNGIYDGTTYYLFGNNGSTYGSVFTSTNGTDFTLQPMSAYITEQNAAYVGGKYFQVGNEGFIVSSDGINWKYTAGNYYGIASNGSNYVAVGGNGSQEADIFTSSDWQNWKCVTPSYSYANFTDVTYGGGKYVAVGNAPAGGVKNSITATSDDGDNWTIANSGFTDSLRAVTYGSGKYIAVGANGRILSSTDGKSWTSKDTGTGYWFYGVSYVNNYFVAVGGSASLGGKAKIKYSTDGETWTDVSSNIVGHFDGIAYGGGKYLLVGRDNTLNPFKFISVTTNDITSNSYSDPVTPTPTSTGNLMSPVTGYCGVAYGNGVFTTVSYTNTTPEAYILTSTDGTSWTATDANTNGRPIKVMYDGSNFKVVGLSDTKLNVIAEAPKSTVATVTSGSYTVSAGGTGDETITNVPYGTTEANFVAALTKGESHESFDETSLHDPIVTGDKIVVTAEDGTTKVTYTITVNPAQTAANASNNTIDLSTSSIIAGGTITITAAGDRQEAAGSVVGDERYIPNTWTSTESGKGGSFNFNGTSYNANYVAGTAGSYTITANYKKQKWNGSSWIDVLGASDSKSTSLTVSEVTVTIGTDDLPPAGTVGVPYTQYTFTSAGGTGNKTYFVTAGSLPAGLHLSEDGVLSGTPTEAGTKAFTVTVNDDGVCEPSDSHEFTITVNPAPKSTVATVTSTSYTVSTGGTGDQTITNVLYGTSKADFIAALTKGESHESFDETGLHDPVATGDKIVVTAEDGTTKITYTVTVNPAPPAPKSTVATVTSTSYTVSTGGTGDQTITNVLYGTTKSDFIAALTKGESHESFDETSLHDPIVTGDKIVVTAEDGTTKVTYTIAVNAAPPAPKSTVATVTSTSYTVSAAGTANETITNVLYGTTKTDFIAALTKGESHESFDETGLHDPIVTGDKIVVTAEDGTTKITYTIAVNAAPPAPKSTVATVTSGSYTVSAAGTGNETITNVLYGTSKTDFIAALTKGESHESFDETGLHDPVATGDKIVVTAEDGTTKITYTVTVNPAPPAPKSTVATVTSGSYTVSAGGTGDQTITNVLYGTTKSDFIAALTKGESHESFDETGLHDPVVSGDKIVVTAEDGTTKITYTVTVNPAPTAANASNNTVNLSTSSTTAGGTITIKATGDRQEAAGAVVGDERYIPNTWTSTESGKGGSFSFNGTSYNANYVTGTAGSYTITANYKKQNWNGSSWVDILGISDSKTKNITVSAVVPPTPVETTGTIVDDSGKSVEGIKAQVTTETDGTKTVAVKSQDAIVLRTPDGTVSPLTDISGLSFSTTGNTNVTLSPDGTIKVKDLANDTQSKINVTLDVGNGQKIIIGTIDVKVSESGDVSLTSSLIDPYGIITDSTTGKAISGANVTLYYANTDRNKAAGKTPDTAVQLPEIADFKPNSNKNPQISDLTGAYGFMVYPTTDYYIVATKDGYNKYTSSTISVENEIVKHDFSMNSVGSSGGSSGGSGTAPSPAKPILERIYGQDRINTAIAIAKATYKDKLSKVIIASSENYPDALAGSVLAYKEKAPILLVGKNVEDQEKVIAYMKENMNSTGSVYILGGIGSVSKDMESKINAAGFSNITRIGGADRYETAAKIADIVGVKEGTPIVIVSGENYPDAISASSIAAVNQYPIFMVSKDKIPDIVKNGISTIKPTKVYIIGLQGAVSTGVEDQLKASVGKTNVVRIGGQDRYETSLNVAKYFNTSVENVCVASGENFPDALTGSSYAANNKSPVILLENSLTEEQKKYLKDAKLNNVTIFGGTGAVTAEVENEINEVIKK